MNTEGAQLAISDLGGIIHLFAQALPNENDPESIVSIVGLASQYRPPIRGSPVDRWQAAVQAALDSADGPANLVTEGRKRMPTKWKQELDEALRRVGATCVQRAVRVQHPELGDRVEALMAANTLEAIRMAANGLRWTALSLRRMATEPLLGQYVTSIALGLIDPEQRRMDLADLAVDVVTATDYLLDLLGSPSTGRASGFTLEHGIQGTESQLHDDPDMSDRRRRRQLDARATAVKLGSRLLAALQQETR